MKSKFFYFFVALLFVSTATFAGTNKARARSPLSVGYETTPTAQSTIRSHGEAVSTLGPGDSLGLARYDYGTNGGPLHNIVNYGDGTLAVGRMASKTPAYVTASWPDRGTWYTYYNGTTWTPFTKVETARRGWGNIDQFVDGDGTEVTASHVGPEVDIDASKGAGSWTKEFVGAGAIKGAQWPRLATGKGANVYVIGSPATPDGSTPYLIKSTDGGATFDTLHQNIWTTAKTGDADAYDVAVYKGGTTDKVAVMRCPYAGDIDVVESTDAGVTWTETLVYAAKSDSGSLKHNESQLQSDGTGSIIYDNRGNLHVVWGNFEAIGDSMDRTVDYYSLKNAILHWDKLSGKISTVAVVINDSTIINKAVGYMPGVDGAFVTSPDIAVDASNNLYVSYFGVSLDIPADSLAFNHVYATYSTNLGSTWKVSTDLTPVTGSDNAYPSMADLVDANMHIVYLTDPLQGNSVQGSHGDTTVVVKHLKVPVSSLNTKDLTEVRNSSQVGAPNNYSLDQNYPNPFNPSTAISFGLPVNSTISLKVFNILGQEVATLANGSYNAGVHVVNFDASKFASGMYIYKLESANFVSVKKMMLVK